MAKIYADVTNRVIRKGIAAANEAMSRGIPMHEPLSKNKYFPPLVTQMIAIGEESGRLDSMLTEGMAIMQTGLVAGVAAGAFGSSASMMTMGRPSCVNSANSTSATHSFEL